MHRREALIALATLPPAVSALAGEGQGSKDAQRPEAARPIAPGGHTVKPLPFEPGKLSGLSAKLLTSHHENNYAGAVKNLNAVEQQLTQVTKDTPGFVVGGLKERELLFTNSVILHELYFGNLGGNGRTGGAIAKALAEQYGSLARWEELFRATGASLAGGSGWTLLDFNLHTGDLRTYWSGNHTQSVAFGQPLLVMDMYEHAYALDYGAKAAPYIDAFFRNLQWDEVNRRLERAQRAWAVQRG
ncbi:MAG: superoxide dismutase [Myxococcaceae bacterium]|nr:superoxide dismutase [Myxococcaceae bacterium]MCI0671807.1 superoxide dismutase [Myxococcaceae bacterium]